MLILNRKYFLVVYVFIFFWLNIICEARDIKSANIKRSADDASGSSSELEPDEKNTGTLSPEEMEKLKEQVMEKQSELSEKLGIDTDSPIEIEDNLKTKEQLYGKDLPKEINEWSNNMDKFANVVEVLKVFREAVGNASENYEEVGTKSPLEMKRMKEEFKQIINDFLEKKGYPNLSSTEFEEMWENMEKEYGSSFQFHVEKSIAAFQALNKLDTILVTSTVRMPVSEESVEIPTSVPSVVSTAFTKEEAPKNTHAVWNSKGRICILAKFDSELTIAYPSKGGEKQLEVSVPVSGHVKGKCETSTRSPMLQISWEKFVFTLLFNKSEDDKWVVTSMELTYDTSEAIFDRAANTGKMTARSKVDALFETPLGEAYFCPAQEMILLYSGNKQVVTAKIWDIYLQPYEVEEGKFSSYHRCNKVVIGLDEEPFVQDETVPLAVGCTLALITLLILVGFSVHRAYHAAKVDYNSME